MKKAILSTAGIALAVIALSAVAISFAAINLNPNKLYGAPSYVLNLIGKKDGWSGGGSYDNPDRHTMFLPQPSQLNLLTQRLLQITNFNE